MSGRATEGRKMYKPLEAKCLMEEPSSILVARQEVSNSSEMQLQSSYGSLVHAEGSRKEVSIEAVMSSTNICTPGCMYLFLQLHQETG